MLVFAKSSAEDGAANETILAAGEWALWAVIGLLQSECSQPFSLHVQNPLLRPLLAEKQWCDRDAMLS
jgi:hypothetical protein